MQEKYEKQVDRLVHRDQVQTSERNAIKLDNKARAREQQEKLARLDAREEHRLYIQRNAEIEFKYSPVTEVPDEVKLPMDYFEEAYHKTEYNKIFADYYYQRYLDTNLQRYADLSQRIENCHKSWFGDHYKKSEVFNVKHIFHCHNRWCWLCSHLEQAQRLYKYTLKFERLLKDYDLYHIVFTVKNVKGDVLEDTLTKMKDGVYKIIRYFQGRGTIKGIDFEQYGFVGAIRSFEIVIYPTEYHPHIHCLFLLKKGLELDYPKTVINKFSFDHGILKRKFSEFEVLLQKMFYVIMNGQKVTLSNIQTVKDGYSCIVDHIDDDNNRWHEVFKYATKMSKAGASACTYEQFVLLDNILRRFKMTQGYGIFYNEDKDDDEYDPTVEILFEKILIMLNNIEKPDFDVNFQLEKLVDELHKNNLTVISKKMSYKYMETVFNGLRAETGIKDGFEPF